MKRERSRERIQEEEELKKRFLLPLREEEEKEEQDEVSSDTRLTEEQVASMWDQYGIPKETMRIVLLHGGVSALRKLLTLNKASQKLELMWDTIYEIRFGEPPYWFRREYGRRMATMSDAEKITAYKNLYAWTNAAVSLYLNMDEEVEYSMVVMAKNDENQTPYTVKFMYGRERPKSTVMKVGADGELVVAPEGLKLNDDVTEVKLQFYVRIKSITGAEESVESNFELPHVTAKYDLASETATWKFTGISTNFTLSQLMKGEDQKLPNFMLKMERETILKWRGQSRTLYLESHPHLKTMFMNHYYSEVEIVDAFKAAYDKLWHSNNEAHFPLGGRTQDDFVAFCFSLFVTEPLEYRLLALEGYIGLSESSQNQWINKVAIPVIFDMKSLPLTITFPLTCCVCAKPSTLTCEDCNVASYCSDVCRSKDFKVHRHDKICTVR